MGKQLKTIINTDTKSSCDHKRLKELQIMQSRLKHSCNKVALVQTRTRPPQVKKNKDQSLSGC